MKLISTITNYYYFPPKVYNKCEECDNKIKIKLNSFEFLDKQFYLNKKQILNITKIYINEYEHKIIVLNCKNDNSEKEIYINLTKNTFFNKIKLKWIFKLYWIQKEGNLRYLINMLFLGIGVYLSFKQIK